MELPVQVLSALALSALLLLSAHCLPAHPTPSTLSQGPAPCSNTTSDLLLGGICTSLLTKLLPQPIACPLNRLRPPPFTTQPLPHRPTLICWLEAYAKKPSRRKGPVPLRANSWSTAASFISP